MKSNHNNQHHDRHAYEKSNHKKYDDFDILEPAPDIDLTLPDDEDNELSDYSFMGIYVDPDYEEY